MIATKEGRRFNDPQKDGSVGRKHTDGNQSKTIVIFLLIGAVVTSSFAGPAVGVVHGFEPGVLIQDTQIPQENNTTIHHEDPQSVNEEGNISELEGWLSSRMSQSLINCTDGLKVGQYDACNRSRGAYPDWLGKYVNVTRETDSEENHTKSFKQAREKQEQYASNVSQFRNTFSAYQTARQNGNTTRARTLARRLQRTATRVNNTSGQLNRNYRAIANGTNQNLSSPINTTTTITQNVTETAQTVEIDQFVNTTITASASSRRISFHRPLQVSGQLTTANGTALENQLIRLEAGTRRRATTTNEDGEFSLTYRPTVLPLDTEHITVRYVPQNLSVYRDNETTLPVRVKPVEPTLKAAHSPEQVAFNDTLTISGQVSANDTGATSVPIAATINRQSLVPNRTIRTNENGRFRFTTRLPANIPAGQQTLRVSLPMEGRALNQTAVANPITINRTPTRLTVNGTQISVNGSNVSGPEVRITGRLTTANGAPIPNETVGLRLNGTTVGETETNANGQYDTNVTVPEQLFADRSGKMTMTVAAVYNNRETNLAPSQSDTQLTLLLPQQPPESLLEQLVRIFEAVPIEGWVAIGVGILLLILLGATRYRNRLSAEQTDTTSKEDPISSQADENQMNTGKEAPLIEIARNQLFAGNKEHAIAAAYAEVRTHLGGEFGITTPYTHWEFFDMCRVRGLDNERLDALQQLTELYERAAFSADAPSEDVAATAIEEAEKTTSVDRRPPPSEPADD